MLAFAGPVRPLAGAAPLFWSTTTVPCPPELLNRARSYVVSYARTRKASSGPQSVSQDVLATRTASPSTAVEDVFSQRSVRLKPRPVADALVSTSRPEESRSNRSGDAISPTSPETWSTTTSYDEYGRWLIAK